LISSLKLPRRRHVETGIGPHQAKIFPDQEIRRNSKKNTEIWTKLFQNLEKFCWQKFGSYSGVNSTARSSKKRKFKMAKK